MKCATLVPRGLIVFHVFARAKLSKVFARRGTLKNENKPDHVEEKSDRASVFSTRSFLHP